MLEKILKEQITPRYFINYLGKYRWVACDRALNVLPLGEYDSFTKCEEAINEFKRIAAVGEGNRREDEQAS